MIQDTLRVKQEGDALGVFSSSSHENFEAIGGKMKYNDCIAVFEKKTIKISLLG